MGVPLVDEIKIKRGDVGSDNVITLYDQNDLVDLTDATEVRLLGRRSRGPLVMNRTVSERSPAGEVPVHWLAADLADVGWHYVEVQVTWPDTSKQTFPAGKPLRYLVTADLG